MLYFLYCQQKNKKLLFDPPSSFLPTKHTKLWKQVTNIVSFFSFFLNDFLKLYWQTSDFVTLEAVFFTLTRSLNVFPPPARRVLRAASHWLDRTRRPWITGAEDQEGALPGQAGSSRKPGGSVGESRPRGHHCHPRHLQPRSVEYGTHAHMHTQCCATHTHS